MSLTPDELDHGVRAFVKEPTSLPIFLEDDDDARQIGTVTYEANGGVKFELNKEFMDRIPPNVRIFSLIALYTHPFEPPKGVMLRLDN